ncbi:MAG: recombinase zinc beta ribbon domain-containing protein [Oscillospiraceae bacterium]|nr:recombinase zinc beta ribbon domain-containing protein [Oscillospiraceae bacterium]
MINGKQSKKNIYTDERIQNPEEMWHITERPDFRIISDETFNKAQELIKSNAAQYLTTAFGGADKAVRRSEKHLFSNIIKCNTCGFSYRRTRRKNADGSHNAWWICSKRAAYGTARCTDEYVRIDENWLKQILDKLLHNLVDDKDAFFKMVEASCSAVVQEYIKKTAGFDIYDLESELQELKEQRERLKTMTVKGILSMEEAERDIIPLNGEIERLTFALNQTDSTRELTNEVKSNIKQFFKAFEQYTFNDELDNTKLKMLLREIRVVSSQELQVYFNIGDNIDNVSFPISITHQTNIDTNTSDRT